MTALILGLIMAYSPPEIVDLWRTERGECSTSYTGLDKDGALIVKIDIDDGWMLTGGTDEGFRCERITPESSPVLSPEETPEP